MRMRMLGWMRLVACVCVGWGGCLGIKEASTGVEFAPTYAAPAAGTLTLAGVGVRIKKIAGPVGVKVYAVGVYLDKNAAASLLRKFKGSSNNDEPIAKALIDADFGRTITLKMVRTVGAQTMVDALAESVKPRMGGKSLDTLATFQDVLMKGLAGGKAVNGMQFTFGAKSGKMTVGIDGSTKGSINSPVLCKAFIDTYLGNGAVSPAAKQNVIRTVCSWL